METDIHSDFKIIRIPNTTLSASMVEKYEMSSLANLHLNMLGMTEAHLPRIHWRAHLTSHK